MNTISKGQIPSRYPARELVRELDSVMEFGLKQADNAATKHQDLQ